MNISGEVVLLGVLLLLGLLPHFQDIAVAGNAQ
jgi:hypothetical protein